MAELIDILTEPKGQTYASLIEFAGTQCATFSLSWRKQFRFDQTAHRIADLLKPFLVSNVSTSEWPGTQLIGHEAILRRYRIADKSLKILAEVDGLYSWTSPELPEDLAFYSTSGECWLASISHERQAWFQDERLTLEEIRTRVPGIEVDRSR
jgi:hypothetical protein